MQKTLFIALLLGVSLTAAADTSVDQKKGKPGAACKTSSDCDQSSQLQSCTQGKCRVEQPPPPT